MVLGTTSPIKNSIQFLRFKNHHFQKQSFTSNSFFIAFFWSIIFFLSYLCVYLYVLLLCNGGLVLKFIHFRYKSWFVSPGPSFYTNLAYLVRWNGCHWRLTYIDISQFVFIKSYLFLSKNMLNTQYFWRIFINFIFWKKI